MRRCVTNFVFVLLVAAGCVSAPPARAQTDAAPYGTNLITNGDAEGDFGADDASTVVKPTGWTTTGAFSVVRYGAKGDFPDISTPGSGGGEQNFFAGGNAAVSTATQTISLTPFATEIDAGRVKYALIGKLGGWGSLQDSAVVTVTFKNASQRVTGSARIGPVEAAQRLLNTAFLEQEQSGTIPPLSRTADVEIVLTRAGSAGYNHGFVDSLSFAVTR
ncbi:MAG: hypothetical protein JO241_09060 [Candidatus Eremiobacteraeota bacterium]|nr:hypothetical protein [Candidatus Eremiobacteraeota bacterium]